jgi:general secretion pathway protein K
MAVSDMGLDDKLTVTITDELSKIQVNAMIKAYPGNELNPDQARLWENLLRAGVYEGNFDDRTDPAGIINSVKDWLDDLDDEAVTGLSGAESDYYLGLDPGYECSNGPFNHVDELLSVKGISRDMLMPEHPDETGENGPEDLEDGQAGRETELENVFTVYGLDPELTDGKYRYTGKININTANVTVLAALLPEGLEDLALDLADFRSRRNEDGNVFLNLLDKGWYKKVIDLPDNEQKKFDAVIGYSSDIFRVDCRAEENSAIVHLVAVIKREKDNPSGRWICRVIQMERK